MRSYTEVRSGVLRVYREEPADVFRGGSVYIDQLQEQDLCWTKLLEMYEEPEQSKVCTLIDTDGDAIALYRYNSGKGEVESKGEGTLNMKLSKVEMDDLVGAILRVLIAKQEGEEPFIYETIKYRVERNR